ncbi:hypothetical protein C922_05792, partial [Plasmodium inui San Antonio 1]
MSRTKFPTSMSSSKRKQEQKKDQVPSRMIQTYLSRSIESKSKYTNKRVETYIGSTGQKKSIILKN